MLSASHREGMTRGRRGRGGSWSEGCGPSEIRDVTVWDFMSSLLTEGGSSSWLPDTYSGQYGIQLTVCYRHWDSSDEGTSSFF